MQPQPELEAQTAPVEDLAADHTAAFRAILRTAIVLRGRANAAGAPHGMLVLHVDPVNYAVLEKAWRAGSLRFVGPSGAADLERRRAGGQPFRMLGMTVLADGELGADECRVCWPEMVALPGGGYDAVMCSVVGEVTDRMPEPIDFEPRVRVLSTKPASAA